MATLYINRMQWTSSSRFNNSTNWHEFFSTFPVINIATNLFTEKFLGFAQLSIPNQTITVRPDDKLWYNSKIVTGSQKRNRLTTKIKY